MKNIIYKIGFVFAIISIVAGCSNEKFEQEKELNPYVNFLKNENLSSKDYIFNLFEKYDVVILSERLKTEATQWDFISELISDKRFADQVGNVFTEYGMIEDQGRLDSLLLDANISNEKVRSLTATIMRNLSHWPAVLNTGYYDFLKNIRGLNLHLEKEKKIGLWFCDGVFDWKKINRENYSSVYREYMAKKDQKLTKRISDRIKKIFNSESERKKALVVLYHANAFGKPLEYDNGSVKEGVGVLLANEFKGKTAFVLTNNALDNLKAGWFNIAGGKWDAAFAEAGNPLSGFDFESSPFGADAFDQATYSKRMKEKNLYKDIYTGFVFTGPIEQHQIKSGFKGLLDGFETEYLRRANCIGEAYHMEIRDKLIPALKMNTVIKEKPGYAITPEDEVEYFLSHPVFYIMLSILAGILYLLGRRYKRS